MVWSVGLLVCLLVGRCVHTHASDDVGIEIDGSR